MHYQFQREMISNHAGLTEPPPPAEPALDDPFIFREMDENAREATLRDIELFEKSKGLAAEKGQQEREDSD